MSATYARIAAVVRRIPRGKVMTYGAVAAAAGMPRGARVVGYAMHTIGHKVPWQRVVGARGKGKAGVSIKDPVGGAVQRKILEAEGVRFGRGGGIDLSVFGWGGAAAPSRKRNGRPERAGR
jgi:methylated-DNA-protein-cysteine methyltransferase-like protein